MTFKPTMALLMLNLSHEDKQKVQDGRNKRKLKTQHEDPTFFMCMYMVKHNDCGRHGRVRRSDFRVRTSPVIPNFFIQKYCKRVERKR